MAPEGLVGAGDPACTFTGVACGWRVGSDTINVVVTAVSVVSESFSLVVSLSSITPVSSAVLFGTVFLRDFSLPASVDGMILDSQWLHR